MNNIEKKNIIFTAPLEIRQGVKLHNGKVVKYIQWDIGERFFRWLKSLLPKVVAKEVGSLSVELKKGYFWIGDDGQLTAKVLPVINENTEKLTIRTALSITINEDKTIENQVDNRLLEIKMNASNE